MGTRTWCQSRVTPFTPGWSLRDSGAPGLPLSPGPGTWQAAWCPCPPSALWAVGKGLSPHCSEAKPAPLGQGLCDLVPGWRPATIPGQGPADSPWLRREQMRAWEQSRSQQAAGHGLDRGWGLPCHRLARRSGARRTDAGSAAQGPRQHLAHGSGGRITPAVSGCKAGGGVERGQWLADHPSREGRSRGAARAMEEAGSRPRGLLRHRRCRGLLGAPRGLGPVLGMPAPPYYPRILPICWTNSGFSAALKMPALAKPATGTTGFPEGTSGPGCSRHSLEGRSSPN